MECPRCKGQECRFGDQGRVKGRVRERMRLPFKRPLCGYLCRHFQFSERPGTNHFTQKSLTASACFWYNFSWWWGRGDLGGNENFVMIGLIATAWYECWTSITLKSSIRERPLGQDLYSMGWASLTSACCLSLWAVVNQGSLVSHPLSGKERTVKEVEMKRGERTKGKGQVVPGWEFWGLMAGSPNAVKLRQKV